MLKMLTKNKKWSDYISIKDDEVRIAFGVTLIICVILWKCNLYQDLSRFEEILKDICLSTGTGAIGIIGLALSGVAIITGLFSKEQIDKIEKYNGEGSFERVMSSFLFLSLNCALLFVVSIMFIFILTSMLNLPDIKVFFGIVFFYTYFTLYNIFYAVSLVGNCISIFKVRNIYEKIKDKDFYDIANEIRIDHIYSSLLKKYNIPQNEFLEKLEGSVQDSDIDCKQQIIDYYYLYYTGKPKNIK